MALFNTNIGGGGVIGTAESLKFSGNTYTFAKAYSKVYIVGAATIGLTGMTYSGSGSVVQSDFVSGAASCRSLEIDNVSIGDTIALSAGASFAGCFIGFGIE